MDFYQGKMAQEHVQEERQKCIRNVSGQTIKFTNDSSRVNAHILVGSSHMETFSLCWNYFSSQCLSAFSPQCLPAVFIMRIVYCTFWFWRLHFEHLKLLKIKEIYLKRLLLSQNPRDSMKHFEISVLLHIRVLQNWGKQLIKQPSLTEWICNLTPKLEIYWKYCGKEEQFLLFYTIFCCL